MSRFRFASILGTMDEEELLAPAIAHLRRIGVELVIVHDHGSTDGSLAVLAAEERAGDVWVVHIPHEAPDAVASAMLVDLARASDAEWVLFHDSDERWLPRTGSLHDLAGLDDLDALVVPRFNVAMGADGPLVPDDLTPERYAGVALHALPIPDAYLWVPQHPETPWIRSDLEPKVMARPGVIGTLVPGNHGIVGRGGTSPRVGHATDVLMAHLPFTSLDRFRRKVANVRRAIEMEPAWFERNQGWQWTMWSRLDEPGTVAELAKQRTDPMELPHLRDVMEIASAADLLAPLVPEIRSDAAYEEAVSELGPWRRALHEVCLRERIRPMGPPRLISEGYYVVAALPPEHVVKLYGPWRDGLRSFDQETAAYRSLAADATLPIPRVLGQGALADEWRYVVLSHLDGTSLHEVYRDISDDGLVELLEWLGPVIRRVHATPLPVEERDAGWAAFRDKMAWHRAHQRETLARHGSLPPHLLDQVERWMPDDAELYATPGGPVLLHADFTDDHLMGVPAGDRLVPTGIIDFGWAMVGHPWYELGPIWHRICRGRPELFDRFLATAGIPGTDEPGMPRRALAWFLLHSVDNLLDMEMVDGAADLDALAARMFDRGPGGPGGARPALASAPDDRRTAG